MPGGEVDNDFERELEYELGCGDAGDAEDDEEDDDMVDVLEEELHKQLDDGLGSQDMVGADEYQEDDDFLAQSMEPPPPPNNGAPKSLQELAGAGSFEYEDDSSSSDEDDDELAKKKRAPLVKIDFSGFEADSRKARLDKLRASITSDRDSLFKAKIRWDGISDVSPRLSRPQSGDPAVRLIYRF